jgi:hypothetical protein
VNRYSAGSGRSRKLFAAPAACGSTAAPTFAAARWTRSLPEQVAETDMDACAEQRLAH